MNIFTLLLVVFVTLKLVGVIDWSWWWVLSPLLFEIISLIAVFFLAGLVGYLEQRKG